MIQRPTLPTNIDPRLAVVLNAFFDQVVQEQERYASGPPTSGFWRVGMRFWNNAPVPGSYAGWICAIEGTPGTWKGFGVIAP